MPAHSETVRRQFDRRAARFARHDALVREVGRRMLERLDYIRLAPNRIVDIGCGMGGTRADLLRRYRGATWIGIDFSLAMLRAGRAQARGAWPALLSEGAARLAPLRTAWVCAGADRLPLPDASVDLLFSNLMLHWHPAPHLVFPEWTRVLRPGGLLMFSCFGPDTLQELRAALAQTMPQATPLPFVDMHDFGDMMLAADLATPVMDVERIRLTYASPRALLREAAALGGNPRDDRPTFLPGSQQTKALQQALAQQRDQAGRIALTFEIAYGHAWKSAERRRTGREAVVPLDQLKDALAARRRREQ
jgi:malonyl-CoA O-methyltransferase